MRHPGRMTTTPDAKVIVMIDDMSQLGFVNIAARHDLPSRQAIKDAYLAGRIPAEEIIMEWEDDEEEDE